MRIDIIIDIPDGEKLKKYSKNRLIKIFKDKLKADGTEPKKFKVFDVVLSDCTAIADLDLPRDMVECLSKHRIYYLENLSKYRFTHIYDFLVDLSGKEYVELLNNEMKKYGAKYLDYYPSEIVAVSDCDLSIRAINSLERNNCYYLQNVAEKTEGEILHMRNFGKACMNELNNSLKKYGLRYLD